MKKKLIVRALSGFPIGIAIGYVISILGSLFFGDGDYLPCAPTLISIMGNEINAVTLQMLFSGIVGAGYAVSSVVWEMEHWSIVRQTGLSFLAYAAIMLPIAYFAYWMEHSITGLLSYLLIFVVIFVAIWIIMYFIGKRRVQKMNEKLAQMKELEQE